MNARLLWLEDDAAQAVASAAEALKRQHVIVFPTDTVYGLLGAYDSAHAYRRIYTIKRRDIAKPLALLLASGSEMAAQVELTLAAEPGLLAEFRSGALTVVLPENDLPAVPPAVHLLQSGPVGLRCPAHAALQQLLAAAGGLVWATSLNAAGEPPIADAGAAQAWLASSAAQVQLAVLSRAALAGRPSRVVRVEHGQITELR